MKNIKPLLIVLFLPTLLPAQNNTPLLDLKWVEAHHPSDDLYQKMAEIGAKIPTDYDSVPKLDLALFLEQDREAFPFDHQKVADEFVQLVADHSALADLDLRPEWDRRARYPYTCNWSKSSYPLGYQYKLAAMLILEADLNYRRGDADGDRYLWALSRLAGYNYVNASIGIINFGFLNYVELAEYMVNHMPPEFLRPEMVDWFPSRKMQQDAYRKGLYADYYNIVSSFRQHGPVDPNSGFWTKTTSKMIGFFTFEDDPTEALMLDSLNAYDQYLEGPLLVSPHFKTIQKNEDWPFTNLTGQIWVDRTRGFYLHHFLRFAALDTVIDTLKIHIAQTQSQEPMSAQRTRSLVQSLGLHNLFTGTSYVVTDEGKLLVIPDPDLAPEEKTVKALNYRIKMFSQYLELGI